MKHIAAQVIAYQRLVMFEQLMKMDINKIVRVCVDGIYFWQHDTDFTTIYDKPEDDFFVWSDKTTLDKMTLNNSPTENYLSNIYEKNELITSIYEVNNGIRGDITASQIIPLAEASQRDYYESEVHQGPGGTGKSTKNILDCGLVDMVYIAPSWKLARQMQTDIKNKFNIDIDVNVYYRLMNEPYKNTLLKKYKNVLLDEASQKTEQEKNYLLKILKGFNRVLFVGDFGYQLPPISKILGVKPDEMTFDNIENVITHTEQKRTRCNKLKTLLNNLRSLINSNASYKMALPLLNKNLELITKEQLKKEYNKKDMILCSQHDFKDEYTEMFKHIKKYYVTENNNLYQNGMIIFENIKDVKSELRHAYTIHSIQGETAENNLYIDLRKQKSLRMIYTAISRAKYISQVKLLNGK